MKPSLLGSARTLLLGALAFAAVVIVVSVAWMSTGGGGSSSSESSENGGLGLPPGGPGHRSKTAKPKSPEDEAEDEGPDDGVEVRIPGESRTPEGPEYVVDEKSIRAVFAIHHWEELRRQIDELQRAGKTVPEDVVKALMEMFAKDDLRLDAVLVLGGVTDDATGRALAQLALSPDAPAESRQAALDALAKSGQKAALPFLQQLVTSPGADRASAE